MRIEIDYQINPISRWTIEKPHPILYSIINVNSSKYSEFLKETLLIKDFFLNIKNRAHSDNILDPYWDNGYISGLDAVALYNMLIKYHPKKYVEIGSGNSTKFAFKAINDHKLDTNITSIDPYPRAEIDLICNTVIRPE